MLNGEYREVSKRRYDYKRGSFPREKKHHSNSKDVYREDKQNRIEIKNPSRPRKTRGHKITKELSNPQNRCYSVLDTVLCIPTYHGLCENRKPRYNGTTYTSKEVIE